MGQVMEWLIRMRRVAFLLAVLRREMGVGFYKGGWVVMTYCTLRLRFAGKARRVQQYHRLAHATLIQKSTLTTIYFAFLVWLGGRKPRTVTEWLNSNVCFANSL
jgi:hypothetical protein